MDMNDLKRMEQPELIKLIDSGELIHIDSINQNNAVVINKLSDCGYCVVSNEYIQQCIKESEELAKIRINSKTGGQAKTAAFATEGGVWFKQVLDKAANDQKSRSTDGHPIWEDET